MLIDATIDGFTIPIVADTFDELLQIVSDAIGCFTSFSFIFSSPQFQCPLVIASQDSLDALFLLSGKKIKLEVVRSFALSPYLESYEGSLIEVHCVTERKNLFVKPQRTWRQLWRSICDQYPLVSRATHRIVMVNGVMRIDIDDDDDVKLLCDNLCGSKLEIIDKCCGNVRIK